MARADTAYTEADIIALKTAMKRGAKSVTMSDGTSVQLNSVRENMALLTLMHRDVYGSRSRKPRLQEVTTEIGGDE